MRNISLESFLFLFTLKLFILMGHTFPVTDLDNERIVKDNSMMKRNISINDTVVGTPYICVYVPPNLDSCNFISHHKMKTSENLQNLEHSVTRKKWHEQSESNKIFHPHSSMRVSETEKRTKTIIYEIQRCVPPRLPFILPPCTDADISNKDSEIQRLYPFVSHTTHEFPMYNFSTQPRTVSKSV
ncbi:uncharacterized protein LOC114941979 [Nylanderia fulva]|uniref:uncharacterized protein LOC114941979 n=1 Tax=Nylanderia fulva TaxID=613905 RepID=UPI0010FB2878|nr:uncharacterized protein LOC114941979 [Nylanderia fulva]XP_029173021.1 uncharacterized protein LOC114941979 [Nylanderia fulva]XP_029173022.1 uncharacterized protein LOC114941979 [Nylanderia fulva]